MRDISIIKKFTKSENRLKTVFNAIWMMSDRIVTMVISLFVGVLVARYLGPENFGIINYSLSIIAIFAALTQLGMGSVLVKELVNKKESDGTIIGTAYSLQIITSVIAIGLIYFVVRISSPEDRLLHIVSLIQSTYLLFRSVELLDFWFQSRLKSKFVAISRLSAHVIVGGFKLYLVLTEAEIVMFALSNVLDFSIFAFFLLGFYKSQKGDVKFLFSMKLAKSLLSQSWPLILSGIAVTVNIRLDQIMIGQMLDHADVGIYAAGSRIAVIWYFVPMAIINSARPGIMKLHSDKSPKFIPSMEFLFGLIFWFSVGVAIVLTFLAQPLCSLLYGADYDGSGDVLSINIWAGAFSLLGVARGAWIICENLQRYSMMYLIFGLILKFTLNIFLIRPFGILGASYSTLFCQFTVAMIFPLIFIKTRPLVFAKLRGIWNIRKNMF